MFDLREEDSIRAYERLLDVVRHLLGEEQCSAINVLHGLALNVATIIASAQDKKEVAFAFYTTIMNDEIAMCGLEIQRYNSLLKQFSQRCSS